MDTKRDTHMENVGIFIGFGKNKRKKENLGAKITWSWWVYIPPQGGTHSSSFLINKNKCGPLHIIRTNNVIYQMYLASNTSKYYMVFFALSSNEFHFTSLFVHLRL